jgi:hypothetical protein
MELFLVLKQYGPMVLVVAFLLWKGRGRQTRVMRHIVRLEDEYRQCGQDGWHYSLVRPPPRGENSGPDRGRWRPG